MRLDILQPNLVKITLSRRNLASLLAKVDGHPKGSACTLTKLEDKTWITVSAEDDTTHYSQRGYPPGPMHPETEDVI